METASSNSINLPPEIFGSPSPNEEGQEEIYPTLDEDRRDLNVGVNKSPSSEISSLDTSDDQLGDLLKNMQRAVSHSQNVRKRKFFETAIAG